MTQFDNKQFVNSTRPTYTGKAADRTEMDDLDLLKLGITLGLFFGILLISAICYFILDCITKRCNNNSKKDGKCRQNKLFSRLNIFSGGVFFATSFLHLLPESKEEMDKFLALADISSDFPSCEFIVSIGFFLVLIAEQLIARLQKALEARNKAKSLQNNQLPISTVDMAINIRDNGVKKKRDTPEHAADEPSKTVESLSVENKNEGRAHENRNNRSTSIILCNNETCAEYELSPIERPDSLDLKLPSRKDCRDDTCVDVALYTTNRNQVTSADSDGASIEPYSTVNYSNPSMLTFHSHGSSLHKFQSENSLTNYNPVFPNSKLTCCDCHLNHVNKHVNADTDVNNKITTTPETYSYIEKAIEPCDSDCTVESPKQEGYRAIILLSALLFHSIFDGLALGLQHNSVNLGTTLIAILFHKTLVTFSLTLTFYRAFPGRIRFIFFCLFLFSAISPVGCVIGWMLSGSDSIHIVIRAGCSGILQSLATGTFLYVTFIEILGPELGHGQPRLISISFVFFGFLAIALLKYLM